MLTKCTSLWLMRAVIGGSLSLLGGATLAQSASNSTSPFERQQCMIAAYLKAIYVRPTLVKERDRFVIVSVDGESQAYVQCMFAKDFTLLYCEASSGFYANSDSDPRTLYLRQSRINALAKLGFVTGPKEKNYRYERRLGRDPDFEAIATLMLSALRDGYDVHKNTPLHLTAPPVPIQVACRH
jgi:hypothetical protein